MSSDVGDLVHRARRAQHRWGSLGVPERARRLRSIRRELARRAPALADAASDETGKPATDALLEVAAGCGMLGWVASNAHRHLRDRRIPTAPMLVKRARVQYAPLGVIGVIAPWNYPIGIPLQSLPYALGAGNAVVFKPSELTPRTGALLADCFEPAGEDVVVVAQGDGAVGHSLVGSGIDKLVFTGSPATARRILAAAADHVLPVVLELGGKDAMIVCEDADVRRAAAAAVAAAFANAGQTCMATQRVLVHEDLYDTFVRDVVARTGQLRVGRGPHANVGPVARPQQLDLVEHRLSMAVGGGAKVIAGGHRVAGVPALFEPTVVVDVPLDSELWSEESFAPVMSIARVSDDAHAVALANDSSFGLSSAVFTRSRARASMLVRQIEAGGININDAMTGAALGALPFGGSKGSGYGRLQGAEGLHELSRLTSVVEPLTLRMPSTVGMMFNGRRPRRRVLERTIGVLYGGGGR